MANAKKREAVIDEASVKGLKDKIQKHIEDIAKMDIVTAVSTDEFIGGYIPSEVESMASFIGAERGAEISMKMVADKDNNTNREKKDGDLYATILARTAIELDGDIAMILRSEPVDNGKRQVVNVDPDILAAHQANVMLAIENWHFFIRTALDVLTNLFELARLRE